MTKNSPEPENPQRRKFLIGFIAFMGGLISLVLGGSGLLYFLSPAWGRKKEGWLAVGPVGNLKQGDPQKVDYVDRKEDGWEVIESSSSVWVVNQGADWVVYDPHCTHLGCPYRWDSVKRAFICPCHGGTFTKEGQVVSGPPPRPLRRFSSKVENGILYILPGEEA
jgi:menaquinol-cytochrome c reductase iron-sulfur subunit